MQNVPVCTGTTRTCVTTCARGAGTHGDVLHLHTEVFWTDTRRAGGHRQCCLPKFGHVWSSRASEVHHKKPMDLTHFQFENRSREQHVADSSKHSLCLMKLLRDTAEGISTHNTHQHTHTHQHILTHRPTHHHLPSLPTLPLPHPHAHANAHVHVHVPVPVPVPVHVHVNVYVYVYVYMYMYVYVFECVSVCAHVYVYDLPQWFHVTLANISYRYEHIKTCHHESSRTPQHSKWKSVGANGAHSHERTKNSNRSKKIIFATTKIEFESSN